MAVCHWLPTDTEMSVRRLSSFCVAADKPAMRGGRGRQSGAGGYCAWAVDCRGHGDSGWAVDGDYGLDAMIGDLCQRGCRHWWPTGYCRRFYGRPDRHGGAWRTGTRLPAVLCWWILPRAWKRQV